MNIVIVEDEGITAFYLRETLSSLGCQIKGIFDNAKDVLHFLHEEQIDTIFMDINIKGSMDGIQLSQTIYTLYPHITFVFITSYKDSQTIQEAQIVKPLGYLVKPIVESDLEVILMVIKGQHETRESSKNDNIHFKELEYRFKEKALYKQGKLINLSLKEQICLELLIKNENTHVDAQQLINTIWDDTQNRENSLRELIYRLRKKIAPISINSTPNVGYSIVLKDSSPDTCGT